jgi:hypothetical protein
VSAGFDARLKRLEAAMATGAAGPTMIEIVNDPERRCAGADKAEVAGVLYQRLEGEERGAFHVRLCAAAVAAGQALVLISLAMDYGLDDYRRDVVDGTIEIGELAQS